jgi:signal transduction histidine kinase
MSMAATRPATEPPIGPWPPPDTGGAGAQPIRDFARLRRALVVLLAATVLVPAGFLAFYGVTSWHAAMGTAQGVASRAAWVSHEQALKVFELNDDILDRVQEDISDTLARGGSLTSDLFARRLGAIAAPFEHVANIAVYDAAGNLLATADKHPTPPADVSANDEFRDAQRWNQGIYLSATHPASPGGESVFTVMLPRHTRSDGFAGTIAIDVRSNYFQHFYQELMRGSSIGSIALMTLDGTVLSRFPALPAGAKETALPHGITALQEAGALRVGHTRTVPGSGMLLGFRRLGNRMLYVVGSVPLYAVFVQWLERFSTVVAFALLPSAALLLVAFGALRRLDSEERAWHRWQAEASRRHAAEEDYRHALKMESLGRLTGGVAHDFNNLLMVLSANARLIRLKTAQAGGEPMGQQWNAIERAVQTGESLTRRLLSISRKQPTRCERVDLNTRLAEWKDLIDASAGPRCDVHVRIPADGWPVFVDATDLQLALINLVANARDALPATGGRIVVSVRNGDGDTGAHIGDAGVTDPGAPERGDGGAPDPGAPADLVRIAVSDDGCGMAAEVMARAFEPFFTTKEAGKGTGLGLPQVYAFCRQAGGHARITSHPGVGTTVALFLPAARDTLETAAATAITDIAVTERRRPTNEPTNEARIGAAPLHAAIEPQGEPAEGLNLLLVEDDEEVAEATAAVLSLYGHHVTKAYDAHVALTIYHEHSGWDAVISDVTMPGAMNGIDLALALRTVNPELPVILVTGHTDKLSLAQSEGLLVLPKPVDFDALKSVLPQAA